MIEEKDRLSPEDFVRMQQDVLSLRAVECVPRLLKILEKHETQARAKAVQFLRSWNLRMEVDSIGATLFDVFFAHWSRAVAKERFSAEIVELMAGAIGGLAAVLLNEDRVGWFEHGTRDAAVLEASKQPSRSFRADLGATCLDGLGETSTGSASSTYCREGETWANSSTAVAIPYQAMA